MKIVIAGGGKVGYTIAKYLSVENSDVVVIDKRDAAIERINNNLDVMCIKGSCTSLKVLMEAGVNESDIFIAVTDSDELNMLCSLAAKKLGSKYTVARVRNPEFDQDINLLTEAIGIDLVINPEKEAAIEISKLIKFPKACAVDEFSNGRVNLIGFDIVDELLYLTGKRISDIDCIRGTILVCAVEHDDKLIIPNGDYIFGDNDRVYIIGEHKDIQSFFKRIKRYNKKVRTAMIVGGGKISYYLAKIITEAGVNSKIIEINKDKCEELTELLPNSIVINGDGLDEQLLLSENLTNADSFITLTDRDEDNLIAGLFASRMNVGNIITKITRDNYMAISKSIGINSVISPKAVTANKIIKYARSIKGSKGSDIENIYKICNDKAEAIEFIVGNGCRNLGIKFKNVQFKENFIVALIVRNKEIIIPTGDDYLQIHDRVIIVNSDEKPVELNDIFLGGEK